MKEEKGSRVSAALIFDDTSLSFNASGSKVGEMDYYAYEERAAVCCLQVVVSLPSATTWPLDFIFVMRSIAKVFAPLFTAPVIKEFAE
jgi:hypothetical protein